MNLCYHPIVCLNLIDGRNYGQWILKICKHVYVNWNNDHHYDFLYKQIAKTTNRSSLLALPITYTPVQGSLPKLEIIPYSPKNQPVISFLFVEQSKDQMYEIVVKRLNLE